MHDCEDSRLIMMVKVVMKENNAKTVKKIEKKKKDRERDLNVE